MISVEITNFIKSMFDNDTVINNYYDYYTVFKKSTNQLGKLIEKYDKLNYKMYDNNRKKIMVAYTEFIKGNIHTASSKIINYFFSKDKFDQYCINTISNIDLYRGRNRSNYDIDFCLALFHIPFDRRELTKNERYSISGFPCLYLADSIECCLKELNNSDIRVAKFTLHNEISFYDLSSLNLQEEKNIHLFYKKVLLLFAMSFEVKSKDDICFKTNYVISQLVTSAISNKLNKNKSNKVKNCIKYESVKCKGSMNYVFIPRANIKNNQRYDMNLLSIFSIQEVTCKNCFCNTSMKGTCP